MRDGKFPLEKLVTNRYSLDQINEACAALDEGQILGRAIIEL
jgi:Zn-dependent alcohol dehydrogenase